MLKGFEIQSVSMSDVRYIKENNIHESYYPLGEGQLMCRPEGYRLLLEITYFMSF